MKELINEQRLEEILQEVSNFIPPETAIVRARSVVFAHVRKDPARRLIIAERLGQKFIPRILFFKQHNYMTVIALILVIMIGGGGTVAAAQNDNPGDVLYGVKLASEAVAFAATPSGEAKIKIQAKLAERRSVEISALKEKFAKAEAQKDDKAKVRVAGHIEEATVRLEDRIEQLNSTVAVLKENDNEEGLEIVTGLVAKAELMKGILGSIEDDGEVGAMLRAHMAGVQVSLAQFKAKAEVAEEEILRRQASEQGLEQSARGRVSAVSNKFEEVTKLRSRILAEIDATKDAELKVKMQAEFERRNELYQDAATLIERGREALAKSEWTVALTSSTEAFKLLIQFISPLGHERHNIDIKAGVLPEGFREFKELKKEAREELHDEENEMGQARREAEQAFQDAFKEFERLQNRATKAGVELSTELLAKAGVFMQQAKAAHADRKYEETIRLVNEARNIFATLSAQIAVTTKTEDTSDSDAPEGDASAQTEFSTRLQNAIAKAWETLKNIQERKALLEGQGHTFSAELTLQLKSAADLLAQAERLRGEGKMREANETRVSAGHILDRLVNIIKAAMREADEARQEGGEEKRDAVEILRKVELREHELAALAIRFDIKPSLALIQKAQLLHGEARAAFARGEFEATIRLGKEALELLDQAKEEMRVRVHGEENVLNTEQ